MPASKWRISAGPRTVLARSCLECGEFLSRSAFNVSRGYTDTTCSACRARNARRDPAYRASAIESRMRRFNRAQALTRDHATHHGEEWTSSQVEILERDISDEDAALLLGRTYSAVRERRNVV